MLQKLNFVQEIRSEDWDDSQNKIEQNRSLSGDNVSQNIN